MCRERLRNDKKCRKQPQRQFSLPQSALQMRALLVSTLFLHVLRSVGITYYCAKRDTCMLTASPWAVQGVSSMNWLLTGMSPAVWVAGKWSTKGAGGHQVPAQSTGLDGCRAVACTHTCRCELFQDWRSAEGTWVRCNDDTGALQFMSCHSMLANLCQDAHSHII